MKLIIQNIPRGKLSDEDMIALQKSKVVTTIELVGHTVNLVLADEELAKYIFGLTLDKVRELKTE